MNVPICEGDKFLYLRKVSLNKYVLIVGQDATGAVVWDALHPGNQKAYDALGGALKDYFRTKGATLTVKVETASGRDTMIFDVWNEPWFYARKAFLGKGSPEEAQITLQLAIRFKLATADTIQTYCDNYLGLDCNGFVGNFLPHGWRGADWDSDKIGAVFLANQDIVTIATKYGTPVTKLDDIQHGPYLMAMADGNISGRPAIARFGSKGVGHILVTEPGIKVPTFFGKKLVFALRAVEATGGGVGLITANCDVIDVAPDGVFRVKRWSHPAMGPLPFRIYRVT